MSERRNNERRKWGRKVTYPFIDSDGVLVTKNRRRLVDRRLDQAESSDKKASTTPKPTVPPTLTESQSSRLNISDSQAMELEEALQKDTRMTSEIDASIKDIESQILNETEPETTTNSPPTKLGKIPVHPLKMDSTGFQAKSSLAVDMNSEPEPEPEQRTKTKTNLQPKEEEIPPEEELSFVDENDIGMSIELNFKGDTHILSEKDATCLMGRDPSCDVTIPGRYVSRAHATIIFKDGTFMLKDDSFNGTYIKFNNGKKVHVSNNDQILASNGVLSLGEPIKKNTKLLVEFKLRM